MGPSWGQYGTHVDGAGQGGIFVHSVACGQANSYNLPAVEYNKLGSPASHGCIRTCVRNVFVSTTYYGRNQKNSIYFYDMCWKLSPFVVSFYGEYEQTAKADGRYLLVNIVKEKGKNLMKHIYLNLKRFDVPVEFGGVNRLAPVADWASCIVKNTQEELKTYDPTEVEFGMYFPEVHLLNAVAAKTEGSPVQIGCQSVFS